MIVTRKTIMIVVALIEFPYCLGSDSVGGGGAKYHTCEDVDE